MIYLRALVISGLVAATSARAVYAPIPEQDQGKDLVFSVRGGLSHDSNIFGAPAGEIDSIIWTLAPRVAYNASVTNQTFLSASYGLTLDRFSDRPGDKLLDSHELAARLAHSFSKTTTLDLNETFSIARNPESQLPGVTLNTDQSYKRNQLDGRFNTALNPKIGLTVKARSVYFDYRNAGLGRSLDRIENLYGIAGDYAILPEVKAVAEYRHLEIFYRKQGEIKNKKSDFIMGGLDYAVAQKVTLSGRLGGEWRERSAERDTSNPFVEVSGKYDYARESFIVGGYGYTLEETSDTLRFTDAKVNRVFVNVQHALSALIVASGSVAFEPSQLQGRRGFANIDEDTTRVGLALSYLPNKNWVISANYDYDHIDSDDAARDLRRNRVGVNATFSF